LVAKHKMMQPLLALANLALQSSDFFGKGFSHVSIF